MTQQHLSVQPEDDGVGAIGQDRRGADRYRTVWRIAKVMRNGDAGLWRVRNMSDRGMMLAAAPSRVSSLTNSCHCDGSQWG